MSATKDTARIAFCSLATASHLAAACVALRSFGASAPGASLVLLLVSPDQQATPSGITVLAIQDVVAPQTLAEMRRRYTQAELCFALKPFLIAALLDAGHEQVHYVDGDCYAVGRTTPLIDDLDVADLLLTPHSLSPIPDDGRTPAALTVLRGGVFNGGYIGVRNTPQGRAFTQWLAAMTQRQAHNRPDAGMCGDQRWLDLAPVLFPGLSICRRPGANVAYWNLHERPLACTTGGGYTAAGKPLLFFHFSGFDRGRSQVLSQHQDRHPLIAGDPLHALVQDYLAQFSAGSAPNPQFLRKRGLRLTLKAMLSRDPAENSR